MGTDRVGRNHHVPMIDYIYVNDEKYFIDRAYEFIENRETSVAVYARIRAGICQNSQELYLKCRYKYENCPNILKRQYKDLLKELSKALSALDTYFQDLVDRGTLDMILSDTLNFANHYEKDVLLGEDNE